MGLGAIGLDYNATPFSPRGNFPPTFAQNVCSQPVVTMANDSFNMSYSGPYQTSTISCSQPLRPSDSFQNFSLAGAKPTIVHPT